MTFTHNQREALNHIRDKSEACKEAICTLDSYLEKLEKEKVESSSLLGLEGSAARVYFPQMFSNTRWKRRRPRIKSDYLNTTLDLGYNMLFNLVDSLLQVYGFDVYCGVYHKEFYMRKSLACDLMEPMRPIIDMKLRKAVNLKQVKEEDFQQFKNQWSLSYKKSPEYVALLMEEILLHKDEMFYYIQSYYRSFMKGRDISQYKMFEL